MHYTDFFLSVFMLSSLSTPHFSIRSMEESKSLDFDLLYCYVVRKVSVEIKLFLKGRYLSIFEDAHWNVRKNTVTFHTVGTTLWVVLANN